MSSDSGGSQENQWHSPELGHPVPPGHRDPGSAGMKGDERGTCRRLQSCATLPWLEGNPDTRAAAWHCPAGGTRCCARARCSGGRGCSSAAELGPQHPGPSAGSGPMLAAAAPLSHFRASAVAVSTGVGNSAGSDG